MVLRYLNKNERYKIKELYLNSFSDPEIFVEYYCEVFDGETAVCMDEEDEKIISMINIHKKSIVYNTKEYSAAYLYGVATRDEYKKKGYMKSLMKYVVSSLQNEGIEIIYLIPDVDKEIYEKSGFMLYRENKTVYFVKDSGKLIETINFSDSEVFEKSNMNVALLERNFTNTYTMKKHIGEMLDIYDAVKYRVFPIMIYGDIIEKFDDIYTDGQILSINELNIDLLYGGFMNNEDV